MPTDPTPTTVGDAVLTRPTSGLTGLTGATGPTGLPLLAWVFVAQ